jgi:hypothetical protein
MKTGESREFQGGITVVKQPGRFYEVFYSPMSFGESFKALMSVGVFEASNAVEAIKKAKEAV